MKPIQNTPSQMPILKLENISKSFPGVNALTDICLDINRGEVRGIVGENGAGKSTLMKILTGIYNKDAGRIEIDGLESIIKSPLHAQQLGLSIIFQEFNLVNTLSIAENIFVGRLSRRPVTGIDWKQINKDASILMNRVGLSINPTTKVGELSVAQKQMVEIAKSLSFDSKIIIMDEPTATLTSNEIENLFTIIDQMKIDGVTVIYISHRLDEIFRLCDNVTVLRDGYVIETRSVKDITREEIISLMVGRSIENEYPKRQEFKREKIVLQVKNLTIDGEFENISFDLYEGERLGIAGLVGSGRTEIVRAIFGADRITGGSILLHSKPVTISSPRSAIKKKIAFLTEDRKQQGLILPESISANMTLAALRKVTKFGFVDRTVEKSISKEYINKLRIKTPSTEQKVINLSGGNQQKVIISKWLYTDANIIILDEPTRGIDVGAKFEIYQLINQLADNGKSIIMISSELPEVTNMSDRLLVIHDGRLKCELTGADMNAETIMKNAILKEGN